jgi:hypothetical protein
MRAVRPFLRSHRLRISAAGVVGTALLHTLIVLPIFLDLSLPLHRLPNKTGAGASAVVSSREAIMTVVFINEALPAERTAPPDTMVLTSRGFAPPDLPIVVLSPDASPAADAASSSQEHDSSTPPEAMGDQTQHALLYGRYLGQVQARIERAWMRPRTEIGAQRFLCRARIAQDRRGEVIDIKLDHCNGGERWQQSLVSAIRTASPLPAPPDASVYADRLWLAFESEGFRAGESSQGFEPKRPDTLLAAERFQSRESIEHFSNRTVQSHQSGDTDSTDVIHLTIIGVPRERPQTESISTLPMQPSPDSAAVPSTPQ